MRELHAAGALSLEQERLELICRALALHADGHPEADPTIGACWDADRLHLPCVGYRVDPSLLSTAAARELEALAVAAIRPGNHSTGRS